MTTESQSATIATASAKTDWVKPAIVSFTPALDAQGGGPTNIADGGSPNQS